jgi:ankyrin repeat protein
MDVLHAAESGRLSLVKQLVSDDKNLIKTCRHKDSKNRTFNVNGSSIHYASRSGHLNVVKYLLEQDPSIINDRDAEHWTPLHYACYNGHINIVKLLLKYNANVNIKDNYLSQTPIQFAMYRQFEDIVYLLDPNLTWTRRDFDEVASKGNTPVFRKKSNIFLGRYILNENHIKQIELFRSNPQSNDIELKQIQDVELNSLPVRIILTHDFNQHMKKTIDLSVNEGDDQFLRSSTTSTNEHIMVFDDE